jgi:hypothetical protein
MAGYEVGKGRYPDPSKLKMAVVPAPSEVNAKSAKCVASGERSAKSSTSDRIRCSTVVPASILYTLPVSAPGRKRVKTMAWPSGDSLLARESALTAVAPADALGDVTRQSAVTNIAETTAAGFLMSVLPPPVA